MQGRTTREHIAKPVRRQTPRRSGNLQQRRCSMEMAYRERWQAEITELQRILSGFDLREECKWGKALLHNGWKKRRHYSGLQRILRVGLLSGCAAEGPEEAAGAARAGSGSAGDEVCQRQGDYDEGGHHQGLRARGRGGREGRNEGRDEAPRVSRAGGVEGEVPQRSAVQARVRGADAGSAKGIPVPLRRREAIWDADRADREGDACDLRRTRVPGAALDREIVDAYREIVFLTAVSNAVTNPK